MTKAKISEYDASAGSNTDVNGVNIAEGCAPSGINNAIREVMAALKRFETGSDGDSVTVGGSLVVSGSTTVNTFNVDVISEKTSAAGVTIDGVLLKDGGLNTSGQVVFNDAGGDVDFRVEGDGNANLIVADAGVDKVGIGTNTFNTNGGVLQVSNGISFPATQSACSDANTLDDYEEGTFTPILADNVSVSNAATMTVQEGFYTKVGNVVTIQIQIVWSGKGSMGGGNNTRIYGMPFAARNNSSGYFWPAPLTMASGNSDFMAGHEGGTTNLVTILDNNPQSELSTSYVSASGRLLIQYTYRTA